MADMANRDEIDKCKQIAQAALQSGDCEKAVRFLTKAKRMCPADSSIDALLVAARSGGGAGEERPRSSTSEEPSGFRQRSSTASSAGASRPTTAGGDRVNKDGQKYTADQMKDVQRILRTTDYYEVLAIEKNSGKDAVNKAYKKLALKLHPDKNKAPGAEEAFKKVSKAVQCLTSEEKKRIYDQYGDEEHMPQQRRHQQDFVSPEDFFAAFFGGGFNVRQPQRRQQNPHNEHDEGGGQRAPLLQMLPVVMLVLLTLASNFSRDSGSRFSFSVTGAFQSERTTASIGVNYYVAKDFEDHYPDGTRVLAEFEKQVEVYYVRNLHSECDYQEKVMYKKVMIAKRRNSQEELQKARNHPRPACKEVERVKKRHNDIYRQAVYMPH